MSNLTLMQINHDFCPRDEEAAKTFGLSMQAYLRSGDTSFLPEGVRFINMRHHSDIPTRGHCPTLAEHCEHWNRGESCCVCGAAA